MRNLNLSILALSSLLAACGGPSGKDVAMAKQARYTGDKAQIFAATKAAVEDKYKIEKSDEGALGMQTVPKWYDYDGAISAGNDNNFAQVPDKAIRVVHVVKVLPDGDKWIVTDEPLLMRRMEGSPQPVKFDLKDPSTPGWLTGQVDELDYAIYQKLKPFEVKSPGGLAPAPSAPAAPAPAPAAPEAGSAAPTP